MTYTHTLFAYVMAAINVMSDSRQNLQLPVIGVTRTHMSGSSSIGSVAEFFCTRETMHAKLKLPLYSHEIRSWIKIVPYIPS